VGEGDYDPDGVTYTDVVYSSDGTVTIYLDGTVPVSNRQSRALHRDLAIAGHDYFEVAFLYRVDDNPANDIIARASWELMKDAHVSGVYGKGKDQGSINYQAVARPGTDGQGAAILFVGKKTDKTILGFGRLTRVDGVLGTTITANTKTVTFNVAALDCGVGYASYGVQPGEQSTSFFTDFNSKGNLNYTNTTERDTYVISGKSFDMFKLLEGDVTTAEYHFRTNGAAIGDYLDGVIVAGSGAYEKKQPRYPSANGQFQYFSVRQDRNTVITPLNNSANSAFENPIRVTFDTTTGTPKGSVFAFVFQVPVSPLSLSAGAGIWYIRASYDSFWLDLDHNIASGEPKTAGGAVLIGTGEIDTIAAYKIKVIIPPYKYKYSWAEGTHNSTTNPNDTTPINRYFNVNGLVVELQDATTGTRVRYLDPAEELTYEIGMKPIIPATVLSPFLYGIQQVKVIYYDGSSGITYTDSFVVISDGDGTGSNGNYTNIPADHYLVIDSSVDIADYSTYFNLLVDGGGPFKGRTFNGGPGTYVIVCATPFDFPPINIHPGIPVLFIIVASRYLDGAVPPGMPAQINLGRNSSTGTQGAFINEGTINAYYFGMWPFNEPLNARSTTGTLQTNTYTNTRTISVTIDGITTNRTIHETSPYTLNAGGLRSDPPGTVYPPPQQGDSINGVTGRAFFLHGFQGGKVWNVQIIGEGEVGEPGTAVHFYNKNYLY